MRQRLLDAKVTVEHVAHVDNVLQRLATGVLKTVHVADCTDDAADAVMGRRTHRDEVRARHRIAPLHNNRSIAIVSEHASRRSRPARRGTHALPVSATLLQQTNLWPTSGVRGWRWGDARVVVVAVYGRTVDDTQVHKDIDR